MLELIAAILAVLTGLGGNPDGYEVAVRGDQVVITQTGLHGLPLAPDDWTGCLEMEFYRRQAGLPDRFDSLGRRESNCRNEDDVRTSCCHGYWQMWTDLHLKDHRLAPKMADCEVTGPQDLNSDDPLEKQKQACAAKALFDVVGLQAWAL